jgi:metal-sulfur cluster biosynthetic enzyme
VLHESADPKVARNAPGGTCEVGVNIVDRGLVFEVTVAGRRADVRMTPTTPGCPLSGYMDGSIRRTRTRLPEVDDSYMDLVWDPARAPHMMTDEARRQLGGAR